ncbi:MAG: hypothetical protein JWR85_3538, partial [Marmoricola sp.]|nr:hypothetical protein [Marmoricola sp.]
MAQFSPSVAAPAHAAAAPAAFPAPAASLRLGTLNVGLGFPRKLPRIVARCAELELDAVALQEIGDPALLASRFPPYQLAYQAGPSQQEAGVGLLLSLALLPRVRSYRRSSTGRLIGAVLELSAGHQLLLVSAYMPTGLDHSASDSPSHSQAHELYAELLQWSRGMQQVVVLGDLNETLSRWERFPLAPPAPPRAAAALAAASSPISSLQQDGFIDVYRQLHPSAELSPGFTHTIDGARSVRSRLDYVWSKGAAAGSFLSVAIDSSLQALSHHRLLWTEMQLNVALAAPCTTPLLRLRLPNLRAATTEHKATFVQRVERAVQRRHAQLDLLARADSADVLDTLASSLTQLVHQCAFNAFPLTGAAPLRSQDVLQLQAQRR